MAICLELANGEYAGRSVRLEPGAACRVGSKFGIEFAVPDDPSLAPEHFVAVLSTKGVQAHSLGGHKLIRLRDWILAGESAFRITDSDAPLGSEPHTPIDQAGFVLQGLPGLYAMVDVIDDQEWKRRLESGKDPAQPLAEGFVQARRTGGEQWLIDVTGHNSLTGYIVRRSWGRGRAAFLQSKYSFGSLKEFCQKKLADSTARFHDPRWLRVAMRSLPANESADWLGPIQEILVESRLPRLMEHWKGTTLETIELSMKVPVMLPSSREIEARLDSSRPLPAELATWAPVQPDRAEQLIRGGVDLGLSNPGSLILYGLAQLAGAGEPLDKALLESTDRARFMDLFVIATNRRREGVRVPS